MIKRFSSAFNGPQSLGNSSFFWCVFALAAIVMFLLPAFLSRYQTGNFTYFLLNIFLALGVSMMWGCGNILSFGQMAYFGIAGYSYGIIALNLAETTNTFAAAGLAVLLSMAAAAVLGYFLFYGRVSGVYVTIITMVCTLVFETFMAQTSGPHWVIGSARFGGYNGMTSIPSLRITLGEDMIVFRQKSLYYLVLILFLLVYLGLRWLVNSRYGNSLVATGSSPVRTEMLGYDIRRIQLVAFCLAGGLAGISGVLYVSWGRTITPSTMGLTTAALPIVWVAFGGRKSLLATAISAMLLQYFSQYLSKTSSELAFVIQGALLMVVVMYVPEGIIPPIGRFLGRIRLRLRRSESDGSRKENSANA